MSTHNKSREDYLETILLLKREKGSVRSVDIANALSFSKPSISRAISLLKDGGYVTVDEDDHCIELTEFGLVAAQRTYKKHSILRSFLLEIGLSTAEAEECGCEMEHILSENACDLILQYMNRQHQGSKPPLAIDNCL